MRSHYCGLVNESLIGQTVDICGWVHNRRDHGGVIFLDVRDREGLVQVVFEPENGSIFHEAEKLRHEFVIRAKGVVRQRPEGMVNAHMSTGKLEILGKELVIENTSLKPPFLPDDYLTVKEEVRLKYRYLDLRRHEMYERLALRSRVCQIIRDFMHTNGFLDVETPMLTKATPEGARDYLVPSRTHPGEFFALPQSPQLFKQLLMMAGFDKYYQIVRCFRDEDLRADRQPEFTQLDIEMSFIDEVTLQNLMEGLMVKIFKEIFDIQLETPFLRMTYHEAIRRFGSDKPDLRIPLELVDIADLVKDVEFKVFNAPANSPEGRVAALRLPNGSKLSRKELDDYATFVAIYGAKGLAYIKVNAIEQGKEGLQSPILKFMPDDVVAAILDRMQAQNGDVIFFGADDARIVNEALGALRIKLGHDCGLVEKGWRLLWVIDWPAFERTSDQAHWTALHHPFTAPSIQDPEELKANPGASLSRAYDLVLNGTELGGGSIRIHRNDLQQAVFSILGINEEQAQEKFGFLLEALKYGCPPHGGIALGLDRMIMLLAGANSIREVIAFPKTQSAACMLTNAPAHVSEAQLRELHIKLRSTS